jgi:predicted RNA-binding Zn-ribbon protein involved in translation (DUF1610 family)
MSKKKPLSDKQTELLLFGIGITVILIIFVPIIRYLLISLAIILISIYFFARWKRHQKINRGEFYTIEHHCPNCGRINVFRYAQGHRAEQETVTCWYCKRPFTK